MTAIVGTINRRGVVSSPEMSGDNLQTVLNKLKGIETTQIGVIELSERCPCG